MATTQVIISLTHMTCPVCGTVYGLNESQRKEFDQRRGGYDQRGSWYCPMGHSLHYPQQTEEDKLRAKALRLEAQLEHAHKQCDAARAETVVQKRRATRFKNDRDRMNHQIARGVCPHCHRHFENVERHMETKHPEQLNA